MKRTTIFVPETLERDLQLYARREGRAVASVVRDAIQAYIVSKHAPGVVPSFAGVGDSGRSDIAEQHEALLFRDLDPHGGSAALRDRASRPPEGARQTRTRTR